MPFQIKVCGIKNNVDAVAATKFGADAIGLNFYPKSLRFVTVEEATEIRQSTSSCFVGVFVNSSPTEINTTSSQVGLHVVQLHGDESPDIVSQIDCDVIRVIRIENQNFDSVAENVQQWTEAGAKAILLDAAVGTDYGGTGRQLDWNKVARLNILLPVILAGGLNCDNVAQAIETAQPAAVDVASGIEKFPGIKDHSKMKSFINNAQKAFGSPN